MRTATEIKCAGWFCKRCLMPMRRNRYGWYDHSRQSQCECQYAEWLDAE